MGLDSLKNIDEVGSWVDVVESASLKQAVQYSSVARPLFRGVEEPVLTAYDSRANHAFQMVGIDGNFWIFQEYFQWSLALDCVLNSFHERVRRQ